MIPTNFSSETRSVSVHNKYIIFTILPTSITGAIVSPGKDSSPLIYFTVSEKLVWEDSVGQIEFMEKYLSTLDKVCSKLSYYLENDEKNTAFLDSAFVFLTEPWVDPKIINFSDEGILPFSIDQKYLSKIKNHTSDEIGLKKDKVFRDYISAKANGYTINFSRFTANNQADAKVQKLELNVLEQEIKNGFIESMRYIIERNFVLSDIIFDSYFAPVMNISTVIFPKKRDQIILNVYKEFTLMRVFVDSRLSSITKIPLGTNKIIKEIKKIKKLVDYNEAVSVFDRQVSILDEEKKDVEIINIIQKHKQEYVSFINKSLRNYKDYQISPNILLISSDERSLLVRDKDIFGASVKRADRSLLDNYVTFENYKFFDLHIAIAATYLFVR